MAYDFPLEVTIVPPVTNATDLPFTELAIDQTTGDLALPIALNTGVEALRQRILARFRFFVGEWFLDLRQGLPYYEAILVRNPDLTLVTYVFRETLLTMPGVLSVPKLVLDFNRSTRTLTIDPLEIVLTGDQIFRSQPDEFIISLPNQVT